ncbi:protein of unknown function [Pseudomonas sp. JV551A1]|nr:protein of unknown function [Pseudomonas sp. JV551A1]
MMLARSPGGMRLLWERPCVAIGSQSGPGFQLKAQIAGAALQPFRDTRPLPQKPSSASSISASRQ